MYHARRTLAVAIAVFTVASPLAAQSREFSRTVNLEPGGRLRVVGSKGSIRITSWDQPRVEVKARIERPEDVDDDYAARAIEAARIEISGDSRSVAVVSDYEQVPVLRSGRNWNDRRVPPIHYEIRAPRRIDLSVDSDRGPATLSGFEGSFDVVVDRGELAMRDITGDLRVEIDRGQRSRIEGVRGSLWLEADRTDLDVDAEALDRNSRIEVDRGDVEVRVSEAQRLTVRTDISRRGGFHTDFPIQWSSSDPRRSEGHINGGGTELVVESDRARIELRRRQD
jgi:hypothetical protein